MPSTSLNDVWDNILTMWSSSGADPINNISMEECANLTGFNASIPSLSVPPMGENDANYPLDNFGGLVTTLSSGTNTGFQRIMKDSASDGDICNTFFIVYAASYTVRSFMSGTTTVYKNGSSAGTISTARGTLSLVDLVIGDRISFDKPCTIYQNSNPGVQGAYAGYAGYAFAGRIDRYTRGFQIFNLSPRTLNYELLRSSTNNANETSMTSVATGTITSGGSAYPVPGGTPTIANYWILCDQLACAYIGAPPSQDTVMLYPLSMDTKYGWFSTAGHTFAVNNAEVNRTNSGGGLTITGRRADNSSATIVGALNSGRDNAYSSNFVTTILQGGSAFSGDPCAIYSSATSGGGTLFTAESQADGSGGEMTSFTPVSAHARATVSGGGASWAAFLTAGFSGSTPTYPLYADVIMRFNSSGVYQDAQSFTGQNTTQPYLSKAYWGNGSGTGTYASAGDFFYSTVAVQGYQDTDATDKDESNMIMSNDITLPDATSFTLKGIDPYLGYDLASLACEDGSVGVEFEVYSPSTTMAVGIVLFKDTSFNTPFNGEDLFFFYAIGRTFYSVQVGFNGIVLAFAVC
jgi:hypothetical protein|tara:strand:+ start:556 stop:2286 length:1731 start_codon:yes stop_codon:yes gene_type:complete